MSVRCRIVCLLGAMLLSAGIGRADDTPVTPEVSVEVRFVSIADEALRDLQQKGILGEEAKEKHGRIASLDEAGVQRFLEAIQQDIHSNIMQAPKLTALNGQNAVINMADEQTFQTGLEIVHCDDHIEYRPKSEIVPLGLRLGLRSIVSADRRFVRVQLDARLSHLASEETPRFPITTPAPGKATGPDGKPQTVTHYIQQPKIARVNVKRTLIIPDGRTAVLMGSTNKCVGANKYGPPILSDIPIVGRLFTTIGYHSVTQHLLVLVTPRILVEREEEEKKADKPACGKTTICPCGCYSTSSTPILKPVCAGESVKSEEPADAAILRALPRTASIPPICEVSRDNIQIVKERLVDRLDPPRFFPLVGPARLHHCHWKCTVYYTEKIAGVYPFAFHYKAPRIQVVYIDMDHLHLEDAAKGK